MRDLQRRLARVGHDPGPTELGGYAEATIAAVRAFQEVRGLRPDGVCGAQTWSALVEAGYRLGDRLLYDRTPLLRGDDVADLQLQLGSLGFFSDRIDGMFGPRTAVATVDFQRNSSLTADGICGPDTIAALRRVHARPSSATASAVKARVVEREALRSGSRRLVDRRVVLGDPGGAGALVAAVGRALTDQGAIATVGAHPDQSRQAAEANQFGAHVYLGFDLQADRGCTCSYYGRPDYESAGGRLLAERIAEALAGLVGGPGASRAMQLPVLRETRMVAVWCELGDPSTVVEATPALATTVAATVAEWAAAPVEG